MTEFQQSVVGIVSSLQGWCSEAKTVAMMELVEELKPDLCVEIGVFGGRSLIAQAMALKHNKRGTIFGIDPWSKGPAIEGDVGKENEEWWSHIDLIDVRRSCLTSIDRHELWPWTNLVVSTSERVAQIFKGPIDILHIDGNHSELKSCQDVQLWLHLVRKGGYIWFDDSNWTTTQRAQSLLLEQCEHIKFVGDQQQSCRLLRKS